MRQSFLSISGHHLPLGEADCPATARLHLCCFTQHLWCVCCSIFCILLCASYLTRWQLRFLTLPPIQLEPPRLGRVMYWILSFIFLKYACLIECTQAVEILHLTANEYMIFCVWLIQCASCKVFNCTSYWMPKLFVLLSMNDWTSLRVLSDARWQDSSFISYANATSSHA